MTIDPGKRPPSAASASPSTIASAAAAAADRLLRPPPPVQPSLRLVVAFAVGHRSRVDGRRPQAIFSARQQMRRERVTRYSGPALRKEESTGGPVSRAADRQRPTDAVETVLMGSGGFKMLGLIFQ